MLPISLRDHTHTHSRIIWGGETGRRDCCTVRHEDPPGDDQLLAVLDAVRAAVVVREPASDLGLNAVQLCFCCTLWSRKNRWFCTGSSTPYWLPRLDSTSHKKTANFWDVFQKLFVHVGKITCGSARHFQREQKKMVRLQINMVLIIYSLRIISTTFIILSMLIKACDWTTIRTI